MKFRIIKAADGCFYIQAKRFWLWWLAVYKADECDSRVEFSSLASAINWVEQQATSETVVWPEPDWRCL
jgi:hypothetical protein